MSSSYHIGFEHLHLLWYSLPIIIALIITPYILKIRNKSALNSFQNRELIFRVLLLFALLVALLRPYLERRSEILNILALVDISESMEELVANSLINKVSSSLFSTKSPSLIPFAGSVGLPESGKNMLDLRRAWGKLDIGSTDLSGALLDDDLSPNSNVFLISDGYETKGALRTNLAKIRQKNIKIFPIVPEDDSSSSGQFRITQIDAPLVSPEKSSVDIRISIMNRSPVSETGILTVSHGSKEIYNEEISLSASEEKLIVVKSDPSNHGINEIKAVLTPKNSKLPPSSEIRYLSSEERDKILLVGGDESETRLLKEILAAKSYNTETSITDGRRKVPFNFETYSAVIFNNVPWNALPAKTLNELEEFVKDGGGFIMVGGNRSFGLGGYKGTLMEEILPVELVPPQSEQRRVNVAVELVIDKSRSMSFGDKIEFAKEAAIQVVGALKDEDYIGVIGFDAAPFIVVKLSRLSEIRDQTTERIGRLFATGKTNLLPAIEEARRALSRVNAGRKHMIILTDGKVPDAGPFYIEIVRQMRMLGITVSTVMMGAEADYEMLKDMADEGGGSFYQTDDPRSLPKIFLTDIKVTSGEKTLKERAEYLVRAGPSGIKATSIESFPPLNGYVQTKVKNLADLELVTYGDGKAEPLLASWSYGKGRTIAFTSDASGRWSSAWIRWNRIHTFWSEVLESIRPQSVKSGSKIKFDLRYNIIGDSLNIETAVFADKIEGDLTGTLEMPDGSKQDITFTQVVKGFFKATIDGTKAGRYRLDSRLKDEQLTPVAFHLSGTLFGEQKGRGFNLPFLEEIASQTGGKVNPSAEEFGSSRSIRKVKTDLTYLIVGLAITLFCLEIMTREIGRIFFWRSKRLDSSLKI